MTQSQKREKAFEVAKTLVSKRGYIKGYGERLDRVMSGDHSPVENISGEISEILRHNDLIYLEGLIYKPTDKAAVIKVPIEIVLPTK